MQYVPNDTPGAKPNHFGAGKAGFQDGDAATGTRGTKLTAALFNDLLGNVMRVIETAGVAATAGRLDDLADAVTAMAARRGLAVKSANYNIAGTDGGKTIIFDTSGGALTAVLPDVTAMPIGFNVQLRCTGPFPLTVNRTGAQTIDGASSVTVRAQRFALVIGDQVRWLTEHGISSLYQRSEALVLATGSFTVPAGVTRLFVEVWGGGGSGCGSNGAGAGDGGGGGGYAFKEIAVQPGDVIPCTVGNGAPSPGAGAVNGSAGQSSSFGAFLSATGGAGGVWNGGSTPAGGTGIGGDINLSGAPGGACNNISGQVIAAPGGGSPFGGGGGAIAATGCRPGGGGGSGVNAGSSPGGAGAAGAIRIRW